MSIGEHSYTLPPCTCERCPHCGGRLPDKPVQWPVYPYPMYPPWPMTPTYPTTPMPPFVWC